MIQILSTRVMLICLPDLKKAPVDHCDLFSAHHWLCPPHDRFASLDKASAQGSAALTQTVRHQVQDVMGDLRKINPGRGVLPVGATTGAACELTCIP
jgi:hypothetical protein